MISYQAFYNSVIRRTPDSLVEKTGGYYLSLYLMYRSLRGKIRQENPIIFKPVNLLGMKFDNPLGFSSGWADTPKKIDQIHKLGAGFVISKTITANPRWGNAYPRLVRGDNYLINSMGLPNHGVMWWKEKLSDSWDTPRILSIRGDNFKEWELIIDLLDKKTDIFEINFSCPNVHDGVMDLESSYKAVKEITSITKSKIFLKLSPEYSPMQNLHFINNVREDIDGVSVLNTYPVKNEKLGNKSGGLSGDPLYPMLLEQLTELRKTYPTMEDLPIFAIGGIDSGIKAHRIYQEFQAFPMLLSAFFMKGPNIFTEISQYFEHLGSC